MIQDIITYIILIIVFSILGYRIIRYFKKKADPCNGCSSGCSGCPVDDLKKEIEEKKREKEKNRVTSNI